MAQKEIWKIFPKINAKYHVNGRFGVQEDERMYEDENVNRDGDVSYGEQPDQGSQNRFPKQPYGQSSVRDQLQYQYQGPNDELEEPMSMGEWVLTLLIMLIPCVNIVMAFVWAFSSKGKKSKSNYFKAYLIFTAIQIILFVIVLIMWGMMIMSAWNPGYSYYY